MKNEEARVTTKTDKHQKHAAMVRPPLGNFGRLELAVLGAPCKIIAEHTTAWINLLADSFNVAYADADHKPAGMQGNSDNGKFLEYTDKVSFQRFDLHQPANPFTNRIWFNSADLVLVNGNHFEAKKQIVIIHPEKPLEDKLDKLSDVVLILLSQGVTVPPYIQAHPDLNHVPVMQLADNEGIAALIGSYIKQATPALNGLVLTGGQSTRMGTDKATINYHGQTQREYLQQLLASLCEQVYISGNGPEANIIADTFTGLGPFGGILSAMRFNPNAAWLTIACDLPYLSAETLQYLVQQRNPSKMATAFLDSDQKFPEPLITIWEPRAYPVMLQFLAQGYSCPRKVLINTAIEVLQAPNVAELKNVNHPTERDEALSFFNVKD